MRLLLIAIYNGDLYSTKEILSLRKIAKKRNSVDSEYCSVSNGFFTWETGRDKERVGITFISPLEAVYMRSGTG